MRALTYHRVSTRDQNPELAREELRRAVAMRSLELLDEVEETGSGARNDRPGLQRVLEDARRGRVDVVVVWKLDRFGRSVLDVLQNIRALEDAGVRFIAVTQGLDIKPDGDATSRLTLNVLAAVAEFERELTRERVRLGLAKAKREGRRPGPIPQRIDSERVKALRAGGRSWSEVADAVGCTVAMARRRAA